MENVIDWKQRSIGLIEIRQSGTTYRLYVAGSMKYQSSDYSFIRHEYDKY